MFPAFFSKAHILSDTDIASTVASRNSISPNAINTLYKGVSIMKKNHQGFSLIELLIVVVIIGIIAAIAIPNLLASRRSANEGSAISSMRTLHGAQLTYQASFGNGQFAGGTAFSNVALSDLGTPGAMILDNTLDTGVKSGYTFLGIRVAGTTSVPAQFAFTAVPTTTSGVTQTGARRFGVATEGVIVADTTLSQFGTLAAVSAASPLNN